jgi:hypothetical protein
MIHAHAAAVALPVRFWPAASPVVSLKRVKRMRLAEYCSMSRRRPVRVVCSAAALISSKCSSSHSPALGVLSVDHHRAGQAERNLGDADEVLYVSGGF